MAQTIGDRIKLARLERKMTQGQLAQKCGVNRAAVSQWESGESKSPTAENVMRIAKALGKTQKWLITGAEEPARHGWKVMEVAGTYEQDPFVEVMRGLNETERAVVLELIGGYRKLMSEAASQLNSPSTKNQLIEKF